MPLSQVLSCNTTSLSHHLHLEAHCQLRQEQQPPRTHFAKATLPTLDSRLNLLNDGQIQLRHPAPRQARLHGLLNRAAQDRTPSLLQPIPPPSPSPLSSLPATQQLTLCREKQDFKRNGCPNCEEYLHLAGNDEAIELCTSSVYEGLISMADPARSWVAKWQRIDKYQRGTYATKVMGMLPEEVITSLAEEYNIRYIP